MFAIRSPQPLAKSLVGAFLIMSISTKTPIGADATIEWGLSLFTETNGLAIPSCDAAVGKLTNGMDKLYEINFAVSTERPPPIPIIKSELSFLTDFWILSIDFIWLSKLLVVIVCAWFEFLLFYISVRRVVKI